MSKNNSFKNLSSCIKGNLTPTVLTPVFIILEVLLEVFIPLLMATIVDGGLYGEEDFLLRPLFSDELVADKTRFIVILGTVMICAALMSLTFGVIAGRTAAVAAMGFGADLRQKLFIKYRIFPFPTRINTPRRRSLRGLLRTLRICRRPIRC